MRKFLFLSFYIFCFFMAGCAAPRVVVRETQIPAPTVLSSVARTMQTSGYWISRHPNPDEVILTEAQIAEFNSKLREQHLIADLNVFSGTMSGRVLRAEFNDAIQEFLRRKLFLADGTPKEAAFLDPIRHNMFLDGIPDSIPVRYGLVVHYADQRILPTDEALLEEPGDFDFDQLQNSALDVGSPVAILHESRDGKWLYCQGEGVPGWTKKEEIAITTLDVVQQIRDVKDFVVTVAGKADLFLDAEMRQHYDYAQMGTRFVSRGEAGPGVIKVSLPQRQDDGNLMLKDGFVRAQDVHPGYLAYTPRNMLEQAFKLLNAPYGWGGMYGEQDCSRFLQEIFSTGGIQLPRNSGDQAKAGKILARFDEKIPSSDKLAVLQKDAVPGITFLGMKGHIMLYLGMIDGNPYAIHAAWAYRERQGNQQVARIMNKVVVSDLSLGKGSSRGSLLERLRAVTVIGK